MQLPWSLRYPVRALALWGVAVALLGRAAEDLPRVLRADAQVLGSEAAALERELVRDFHSPWARYAVLVIGGSAAPWSAEGDALLRHLEARILAVPEVLTLARWRAADDTLFVADSGRTTFVLVALSGHATDSTVAALRTATTQVDGPTLRWTGADALSIDLRRANTEAVRRAERRAIPLSALLIVVVFGSLVAAGLPVGLGALTILLASGAAALIGRVWPMSILLQSFVAMLGLGLGIDYTLLMVTRYREALQDGSGPYEAAARARASAGRTIVLSGLVVAIGFLGLLALPVTDLRAIGVGGILTAAAAVVVATGLAPVLLALLGHRVDLLGFSWIRPGTERALARWRRVAAWVVRRPALVLLVAGTPLLALGWQARRMTIGIPDTLDLPPEVESARGWSELERTGRASILSLVRVVAELPPGEDLLSPEGWHRARELQTRLEVDPRIAAVRSLVAGRGERPMSRLAYFGIPDTIRAMFVTADRHRLLFEVIPDATLGAADAGALARELRGMGGDAGLQLRVGGLSALRAEYNDAISARLPHLVIGIVLGTLLALGVIFRSVLIPLKAVALNLLSVAGGMGAMVLVFQDGLGLTWLGLGEPVRSLAPAVPAIVFCTVFGLSLDYELFIVTRVAEARKSAANEEEAVVEGVAHTGAVITGAAAIMIAVFGSFALGNARLVQMTGFALAATILIDALVIRIAIGPALLSLAGRWNWWPGVRR